VRVKRPLDLARELLIPARNCRFHFAETRRREHYSSGGSVRSQATMASMSASFIFLK
jgi:hypothetical protein